MLVLIRKEGEQVRIGDDIRITVVRLYDGKVRIGFDAPDDISIHREEVYQRIQEEEADDES